jgi:hypothetical protein
MLKLRKRLIGDYTITAVATDSTGAAAAVSSPGTAVVYDTDDVVVLSAVPTVSDGKLVLTAPYTALDAERYRIRWEGTVADVVTKWDTYFEVAEFVPWAPVYSDYTGQGGAQSEGVFDQTLFQAMAIVDAAIWPNKVTGYSEDAYRSAVCAVVSELANPGVSRETVGKTTLEYADVPSIASAIRRHLLTSGLLYKGI